MTSQSRESNHGAEPHHGWRQKLAHELAAYWVIFAYLLCYFGVFTWYRRLILAEYHISFFKYGIAVIEALVLAKVILIGDAMKLGKRMEGKPLAYVTAYKTVIFALWVAAFKILEHTVTGALHGEGIEGAAITLRDASLDALLAESLVTLFAFVPFFAFRELSKVLGPGRIAELFFHRDHTRNHGSPSRTAQT